MNEVTIGPCRLICGDCREVLPTLPKVDLVLTDPPYGINHSSSYGASWENTCIAGDSDTSLRDDVLRSFNCTLPVAAFGTWKTPPIFGSRAALVWDKGPAFGMGDLGFPWKPSWELVYIRGDGWSGRRDEGVLRGPVVVSWESRGRVHPHQKPDWILVALIRKVPASRIVLDPFMGSGTTGVACIRTGRQFIGIEIDEGYFDVACKRIAEEWDRVKFLEPEPKPEPLAELFS